MDIKTLRRAHLERHVGGFRTAEGFLRSLNDRLQELDMAPVSSAYLSQLRVGPPKGRNIGDAVARKLEKGLGLDTDALDHPLPSELGRGKQNNAQMNNPEFASRLEQLLLRDKRIALKPNGTINVASAAKTLMLGQPTLQRMLSGGSRLPSRPNAERIMSFLDVTFGQLVGTEPLPEDSESQAGPTPEFKLLPVISSVQVGSWGDTIEPGDADSYTPVNGKWSQYAFVLRVEGDSMMNTVGGLSVPHGAHVVVDPEEDAQHGDIVVAKLETHEQATVKKLVIDPPDTYLMPLNPQYNKIIIDEECRIVGVVKQVVIVIIRK